MKTELKKKQQVGVPRGRDREMYYRSENERMVYGLRGGELRGVRIQNSKF